jgi:GNAT superfamily N-acetyltransferase
MRYGRFCAMYSVRATPMQLIPKSRAIQRWIIGSRRHARLTLQSKMAASSALTISKPTKQAVAHICNCGYIVSPEARGRGAARQMCMYSLEAARALGYRAMQFNFVLQSNAGAVRLWHDLGFRTVGTIPDAFKHPELGYVDAFVMHRHLIG